MADPVGSSWMDFSQWNVEDYIDTNKWMGYGGKAISLDTYSKENFLWAWGEMPAPTYGEAALTIGGLFAAMGTYKVAKSLVCDCKKWAFIPNPLYSRFHKELTPAQRYGDKVLLVATTTALLASGLICAKLVATAFFAGVGFRLIAKAGEVFMHHIQGKTLSDLLPVGHDESFEKKLNVIIAGLTPIAAVFQWTTAASGAISYVGYHTCDAALDQIFQVIA